jgi:hypothetical protein
MLCEFYWFYVDALLASVAATVLTCRCSLLMPTSVLHHSWQFISVQDSWCSCLHCIPGSYFSPISAHVPLFFFARTFQDTNNILVVHLFLCTAPVIRHGERIICWRPNARKFFHMYGVFVHLADCICIYYLWSSLGLSFYHSLKCTFFRRVRLYIKRFTMNIKKLLQHFDINWLPDCRVTTRLWQTQQSKGLPLCIICWLPILPTVPAFLVLYLTMLSLITIKQCSW